MDVSCIYYETLQLIENKAARRIVHQGGQSSGKTVNILMALATIAAKYPIIITITSMSFPHLKSGALRDFEVFVLPTFADCIKQYRRTDHVLLFNSGGLIEFKTYETEYDARGAKRQILYVNEANTFDYMTYFQLDSRSDLTVIDYNPTIRFWAHEKVIGEKGTELRISDHRHNPFLTEEKHAEIERFCTFARDAKGKIIYKDGKPLILKGDYELWKVYSRGLTGNVIGLIFPNWTMIDYHDFEKPVYAIDFGYTNDPTAIVKLEKKHEDIYIQEIAYQTGSIPPRTIKSVLEANDFDLRNDILYCEHDPDMVKQLKLLNIRALSARKGKGSIKAGIEKIKEHKVYYTGRNIKKETEKYIWETDDMGRATNVPVDANNHLLDAIRYGVYSHFYRGKNEEQEEKAA